jgi:hypothetical protein
VENQPFFILGKYYNQNISLLESDTNVTNYIDIDLIKQHLLHYRVVTEDIGCFTLADIVCGCWSFILAEIVDVDDLTIKIIPWIQKISRYRSFLA